MDKALREFLDSEIMERVSEVPEDQWRAACVKAGIGPQKSFKRNPVAWVLQNWNLRLFTRRVLREAGE